jgi:type II secretory pathway component PulC
MTLTNLLLASLLANASPGPVPEQVRFVPVVESGHVSGYRCKDVKPGSAYAALGLRSGDVVVRVDNESLDNPATAFEKLGRLGHPMNSPVLIALERDGTLITKMIDGKGAAVRAPATKQVKR